MSSRRVPTMETAHPKLLALGISEVDFDAMFPENRASRKAGVIWQRMPLAFSSSMKSSRETSFFLLDSIMRASGVMEGAKDWPS
jgi:hypothetical protein